jgi:hypothetical protein
MYLPPNATSPFLSSPEPKRKEGVAVVLSQSRRCFFPKENVLFSVLQD